MSLQTVKTQSKYGLITKKKTTNTTSSIQKKSTPSIFDQSDSCSENEEEESEAVTSNGNSVNKRNEIMKANKLMMKVDYSASTILDADLDSSIYDYDGQYDNFKAQSKVATNDEMQKKQETIKPQYITNLMNMAKVREKEKERIYERKLLKERQVEDSQYENQPKFITSAYKQKLLEEKKWQYEDRLAEEVEKRTDVRGKGMQGFYSNLLTKNIAMGSDVSTSAVSAYTVGSQRQHVLVTDSHADEQHGSGNDNSDIEDVSEDVDIEDKLISPVKLRSRSSSNERNDSATTEHQHQHKENEENNIDVKIDGSKKRSREEYTDHTHPHDEIDTSTTMQIKSDILQVPSITSTTTNTAISSESRILSAKERYLERKKLQQNS